MSACDHPMEGEEETKKHKKRENEIDRHCVKQAEIPVILKAQILSPLRIKECVDVASRERKGDKTESTV